MDMIGYDSYFNHDRSTAGQMDTGTPTNVRDYPCDGCKFADRCAERFEECSAFRNWSKSGDFKDSDVGRYIRIMKG